MQRATKSVSQIRLNDTNRSTMRLGSSPRFFEKPSASPTPMTPNFEVEKLTKSALFATLNLNRNTAFNTIRPNASKSPNRLTIDAKK